MRCRRIVATRRGGPEVLQIVHQELPEPRAGEVRVRVLRAGVAFGDLMWQSGKVPGSPKPPYTPGYDLVGTAERLGPGVEGIEKGQMVAALVRVGGYAESAVVPLDHLVPVPDGLDPSQVVCLTLNYLTALQIFRHLAGVTSGKRILVHGAGGGVGTAMLELGRLLGLEMYGTASLSKHGLVSRFGAVPIDYRNEDFVARILDLTGDGVDLVVDHIGGSHLKHSFRTLRPGGHLVSTSAYANVTGRIGTLETLLGMLRLPLWHLLPNRRSARLYDVVTYSRRHPSFFRQDLAELMGYLATGQVNPVVAVQKPLEEARQAQELLLQAKARGKVILVCDER
ncbi:MAG: medium chain dehydrogenase/reductase family protein [Gemmatimonadales bacterium]|jgi:NADPH:quinone reductase-like Zn-dependent oxidoreductase